MFMLTYLTFLARKIRIYDVNIRIFDRVFKTLIINDLQQLFLKNINVAILIYGNNISNFFFKVIAKFLTFLFEWY